MAPNRRNTDVPDTRSDPSSTTEETTKRSPVKAWRINDVHASLFAREHKGKIYYSWNLSRSYRDQTGSFRYTHSLNPEDCSAVAELTKTVREYVDSLQTGR